MDDVLFQEELLWYQRARADWIKDGDRNTSFFHLSTITKQWRNKIVALKNEHGDWIHEKQEVQKFVLNYFKALYTEDNVYEAWSIPSNMFPALSEYDRWKLDRDFTPLEIYDVVKNMGSLKAPGPDGFQALFYQKNWHLVAPSVCEMALRVLKGNGIPQNLNSTFIALIPKVDVPDSPKQFRPIGLCNVAYKIITKALVNRLKPILSTVVAPTQASYVPGRQITDNIVIFQEVLHSMRTKQGKTSFMAIKIDLEKAYDRLRWSFIQDTLVELKLPDSLNKVIMECITTPSLQILWNGEPTETFLPSRGIRQGDSLSPYIFVLCIESYH